MTNYQYGQFSPDHLHKMGKAIDLFNDQQYWETHEELEHHWLEDTQDNARNVYWAVIQVAAALVHYQNKNIIGARGLINKAREKLERCQSKNVETELLYQYLNWKELKDLVAKVPTDVDQIETFKDLFDFRFTDYKKLNEAQNV